MSHTDSNTIAERFYHGTKADLKLGDLIIGGCKSNFATANPLSWVYFTRTLDAATWGAELPSGDGRERIYVVQPTGAFVDDPNLTDKKFPSKPTSPIVRASRFGSSARLGIGSPTRPNSFSR